MLGLQSEIQIKKSTGDLKLQKGLPGDQQFLRSEGEFGSGQLAQYFQAAQLLINNKEHAAALKLLRKIQAESPLSALTIKRMAECCAVLGKQDEQILLLRSLLAIDNCAESLYLIGEAYFNCGSDQLALKCFLSANEINLDNPDLAFKIYKMIGNIYVKCHDFESAEENYNKAYAIDSRSSSLLINFGTLEIQKNNWNQAIARFREAVLIDSENDSAWVGLALVHREFGDFELSWANLERAIEINPYNRTAIQLGIGWVVKDHRWNCVADWIANYLCEFSEDANMSLALAQIWYVMGQIAKTKLELTRTLALEPNLMEGVQLLAMIQEEEKRKAHGGEIDRAGHSA